MRLLPIPLPLLPLPLSAWVSAAASQFPLPPFPAPLTPPLPTLCRDVRCGAALQQPGSPAFLLEAAVEAALISASQLLSRGGEEEGAFGNGPLGTLLQYITEVNVNIHTSVGAT